MGIQSKSKIKLVKILDILKSKTDENYSITTAQLIKELQNYGISCTRETIYNDIKTLNEWGYEIICNKQDGKSNTYCIVDRDFDIPELRILIDSVRAASFITNSKSNQLIDKIAKLGGISGKNILRSTTTFYNVKMKNESIFYNIATLEEAIIGKKQVSFYYFDYDVCGNKVFRKDKTRYTVNPLALVYSDNNYYLVCIHEKYSDISNYRIDRMTEVNKEKNSIIESKTIRDFSLPYYKKQLFSMFVGTPEKVQIKFNKNLTEVIIDKFGDEIKITDFDNNHKSVTVDVAISPMFYGWCCSFGNDLEIISPSAIVQQLSEYIKKLYNHYKM